MLAVTDALHISGDLEGKVKWLDNFQKFQQLHEVIIWPQIWDRDKRFFVPEVSTSRAFFLVERRQFPIFKVLSKAVCLPIL